VPRPAPADAREADVDRRIEHLSNPNARARADVVIELGRMKVEKAVDALARVLSGDAGPVAREASARALGLIGSPRALPALFHEADEPAPRDRESLRDRVVLALRARDARK
jgi:HEAT repeat protein